MSFELYSEPGEEPCMVLTGQRGRAPPQNIGIETFGISHTPYFSEKSSLKGKLALKHLALKFAVLYTIMILNGYF